MELSGPEKLHILMQTLSRAILGKEDIIKKMVIGLAAGAHILFEDVPGVGKTTLIKGLAKAIGCDFRRIQCTPDLLPSDITGVALYNMKTGKWDFQKGPLFTQILLMDEINRTSPKTQSALLEAMEEKQVTVDGRTYYLPEPFFVLATQNPQEYEGTFPLPESQLDRFTMKLTLGYPPKKEEVRFLATGIRRKTLEDVEQVMEPSEFLAVQKEIEQVYVENNLLEYAAELSIATRVHEKVELGISPRGTLHLVKCAMAMAYASNRDYVLPDDIQQVLFPVYEQRLVLDRSVYFEEVTAGTILKEILSQVRVPGNTGGR
jgi:MoxR-like ATPase